MAVTIIPDEAGEELHAAAEVTRDKALDLARRFPPDGAGDGVEYIRSEAAFHAVRAVGNAFEHDVPFLQGFGAALGAILAHAVDDAHRDRIIAIVERNAHHSFRRTSAFFTPKGNA